MSLRLLQSSGWIGGAVFKLWLWDARQKLARIGAGVRTGDRLLEVGCGPGSVCLLLKNRGFSVVPLDVTDSSLTPEVRPVLYDGRTMPFADGTFDVALLLTVLHHTPDPERILIEAARVARRIIVIEDIYHNRAQRYLTYVMDSLVNLEFAGHPHNNKADSEWRTLFAKLGMRIDSAHSWRYLLLFRQACYCLCSGVFPSSRHTRDVTSARLNASQ